MRIPRVSRNRLWRSPDRLLRAAPAALLGVCLLLSLGLYLARDPWTRRVFFFPQAGGERIRGEARRLPARRGQGLQGNVSLYLEEAILGPTRPLLRRVVARETRLQSVVVADRAVYASLSREVLERDNGTGLSLEESLQILANGVYYNFPRVRQVYLLVEGQLPGAAHDQGFLYKKKF